MAAEVHWHTPGDARHEAAFFSAIWEDCVLRVFSRFAFEVRWCEETLSPELVERANLELENHVSSPVGRSQATTPADAACALPP